MNRRQHIVCRTLEHHGWQTSADPRTRQIHCRLPEDDRLLVIGANGSLRWATGNASRHYSGRPARAGDEVGIDEALRAGAAYDRQASHTRNGAPPN